MIEATSRVMAAKCVITTSRLVYSSPSPNAENNLLFAFNQCSILCFMLCFFTGWIMLVFYIYIQLLAIEPIEAVLTMLAVVTFGAHLKSFCNDAAILDSFFADELRQFWIGTIREGSKNTCSCHLHLFREHWHCATRHNNLLDNSCHILCWFIIFTYFCNLTSERLQVDDTLFMRWWYKSKLFCFTTQDLVN